MPPKSPFGEPLDLKAAFAGKPEAQKKAEARIVVDEFGITIDGQYDVERDRLKTHEDILAWVLHLSGKGWFDKHLQRHFIVTALEMNGLAYPHP